jgi:hypothetical protein
MVYLFVEVVEATFIHHIKLIFIENQATIYSFIIILYCQYSLINANQLK